MALTLLLGGARSGKTALAVDLARRAGLSVTVVATGEPRDEEMAARIARHRRDRPSSWSTVEEALDLAGAIRAAPADHALIIECLTLWTSNLLERGRTDDQIVAEAGHAVAAVAGRATPTIAVSNEVGWGIVPMHPETRRFRDVLGLVNSAWSAAADPAMLVVAGRVLPLSDPGGRIGG